MSNSKRHHFIPKFFIKGFTGPDGKVAVFNKIKNELDPIRKSPRQIFFEWNRNTFQVNGEKTDYVEKLYQFTEDQFAPLYKKIIRKDYKIRTQDFFPIIHFIGNCHYRVPSQDDSAEQRIFNSTNQELFLKILKKGSNEEAPKEMYERIRNDKSFIESTKLMLSVADFLNADLPSNFSNWKIYEAASEVQLHLIGDNPVVQKDSNYSNLFKSDFMFPLSSGKTLYHVNGNPIREMKPENRVAADLLLFIQSDKYVCGPDDSFLNAIAQKAKAYDNKEGIKYLKNQVFEAFGKN